MSHTSANSSAAGGHVDLAHICRQDMHIVRLANRVLLCIMQPAATVQSIKR